MIVNTTSRNLDLNNGAVSKSILSNAGPEIQNELQNKWPNGINHGEIAFTKGYKLKCRHVIHGSVINWRDGKEARRVRHFIHLITASIKCL